MVDEEKSHDTPVLLELSPSDNGEDLNIDIHTRHGWTVGHQLMDEFSHEAVDVQMTGYAHDVTHTTITIVSAAGGLAGAAAALNSFFQRHRHRRITVKSKNREVTVQGFSVSDTERLLNDSLKREEGEPSQEER